MPHAHHLTAALLLLTTLATASPALALSPIPPAAVSMTPSGTSVPRTVGFDVWLRGRATFRERAESLQLVDEAGAVIPARVIPSNTCDRPLKKGTVQAQRDAVERKCQQFTVKALKPMPVGRVTLRHREWRKHVSAWRPVAVFTALAAEDREAPRFEGPVTATDASPGIRTEPQRRVALSFLRPKEAHPHGIRYRLDCEDHPSYALTVRDGGAGHLHAESIAAAAAIPPQTSCEVVAIDASDNEGRSKTFGWPMPAKVPAMRSRTP